ncbi:uncharacterized acetyltransferase At3g50280 [Ziziphus jujuba]|uniref:Uncharacterized acetyltransferase At3g50280 n=2 Tax=Ziziphus jujuba TaxID=326968 RepID=A0A6P4A844_ZIZJJ|nr:uncharacterized acetyltransferase At3g50280 [Ziziphus jujuba]KAH7520209.1 hypothetical protein FEM48_Zijuj08G0119900 [Ziziphus jujuba var. spinosa]
MTNTRFISTTSIQPATADKELPQRIELTPWDLALLLADPIQKGLLFHKPTSQLPTNTLIHHLKSTFSATLDIFYPLAGRLALVQNDDVDCTSSFFLHCNGEGAQFLHASANDITVADILQPLNIPDDIVDSFFPMNEVSNYEGTSKPLLAVQVTELVDGIFIGCTINHTVLDGTSFWHFFNTWSRISRSCGGGDDGDGDRVSEFPPVFDRRQYLHGIVELPLRIPFPRYNEIPKKPTPPPLKQRMFHFSRERIAQLKAKANAEMETDKISSLQTLMAHLWISITRVRNLEKDESVTYGITMGMRGRTKPELPQHYLGNSIKLEIVKTTAGELLENGLGWAAWEMNKVIASQTSEEVRKFIEDWGKNPVVVNPGQVIQSKCTMLITGSSPRFNVYGNDFGWGKPIAVRSGPGNKLNGKLTVFPGAEQGSIDFEACLSPEILQALVEDAEFMELRY